MERWAITALLLLAAGGITYGWKPDERGGVEYLIQIPPDQLDELRRAGSISSTIDPAVRGHVSRVVFQIGEGPLPRIMPNELLDQSAASRNSTGDVDSMPIPELEDGSDSMPIAAIPRGFNQSVMKPQAGDSSGAGGFALPPSLSGVGSVAAAPRVDASGRDASNANNNANPNARSVVPPPATRASSGVTLPPFTGGNASGAFAGGNSANSTSGTPGLATIRPGGPSTDPTTARDRNWTMQGQNRSAVPTTDPVGAPNAAFPPPNTATGLNPGDSFGSPRSSVAGAGSTNQNLGTGINNRGNSMALPPGNLGSPRQVNPNPSMSVSGAQANAPVQGFSQQRNDLQGNFAASPSSAEPNPFRSQTQPSTGRSNRNVVNSNGSPAGSAAQLTPEQIAAGAWSVDIYGNPIDREGYPINVRSSGAAANTNRWNQTTNPYETADRQYERGGQVGAGGLQTQSPQFANQPANARSRTDPSLANAAAPPRYRGQDSSGISNRTATSAPRNFPSGVEENYRSSQGPAGVTPAVNSGLTDPPSLNSPRVTNAPSGIRGQGTQPMVTWLLLISFVSNVYLIFWMKKLLVRYRDLVAAKRVSDSRATA